MNDSNNPDPEEINRLRDAMRRMPRLQREIFLAVRLDHLDYREIGEQTGLTRRQVPRPFAKGLFNF